MRVVRWLGLGAVTLGAACGGGEEAAREDESIVLAASPDHASMFGGADVVLTGDFASLGAIEAITIGGVQALDPKPVNGGIAVVLQGAPEPGSAEIVIRGSHATRRNRSAFRIDAPASGVPPRWMAFGASLTHGMQSGGLDARGQSMSYAAQVARAAGVFLALPLVVDGLMPPITAADVTKSCDRTIDVGGIIRGIIGNLWDPEAGRYDLRKGRRDPSLSFRNLAVGGSTLGDIIDGAGGMVRVVERVMELPEGDPDDFGAPSPSSQLRRMVAFDPDVALSGDLLANDLMPAIGEDDIVIDRATDPATIEARLVTIANTLGALHGHYFLGTLIDVTAMPHVRSMRASRLARGLDTEATFDAKIALVRARVEAYNAALVRAASPHPNLHVVDLAKEAGPILRDGVEVDGVQLTGKRFGGLLSFDHLHFSDTGYGVLANLFVRAINAQLATHIPEVALGEVMKQDPFSPANISAAGIRCTDP